MRSLLLRNGAARAGFAEALRQQSNSLGPAFTFPLTTHDFSKLPGGEQFGYIFSDGKSTGRAYGIVPGYFQSCLPDIYDASARSSYVPPKGASNAWANSIAIGNSVINGNIILLLHPEDNIAESLANLSSYDIDPKKLFVFVDTKEALLPIDLATATIVRDTPLHELLPEHMQWLFERIRLQQEKQERLEPFQAKEFHTLVVSCADKRKNDMLASLFPNSRGFEHLRFPGGFVREEGVSATFDPLLEAYRSKRVIDISHTECVAVKKTKDGAMHDPVIKAAMDCCEHTQDNEAITSAAAALSFRHLTSRGIHNISTFSFEVGTGLLRYTAPETGFALPQQPSAASFINGIFADIAPQIARYNQTMLAKERNFVNMVSSSQGNEQVR